jgi:hypothetical protein
MNNNRYRLGKEGFFWWVGVVEDRKDPEKMGRLRVRCFGSHTEDKALIPTESLPWAQSVYSLNGSFTTHVPKEGDWVFGFFADGESAQHPIVLGVLMGKPTKKSDKEKGFSDPAGVYPKRINEPSTNRLARGRTDGTVIQTRTRNLTKGVKKVGKGGSWDEPPPAFAPQYPFNNAIESESGHAFELDDTTGKERVHLAHKNGSYIEMDVNGNRVDKVVKDKYELVMGDDYIYVKGICNITVAGDCNLKVVKNLNVEAKAINLSASGDIRMKAKGKIMLESGGETDIKSKGAAKIGSGGKLSLKGKSAALQGNPLTFGGNISNKVKTPHGIGKIIPTGSASSPASTGLKEP